MKKTAQQHNSHRWLLTLLAIFLPIFLNAQSSLFTYGQNNLLVNETQEKIMAYLNSTPHIGNIQIAKVNTF